MTENRTRFGTNLERMPREVLSQGQGTIARQQRTVGGRPLPELERVQHLVALASLRRLVPRLIAKARRLKEIVFTSDFALAILPASPQRKIEIARLQNARAEASRKIFTNASDVGAWLQLGDALSGLGAVTHAIVCYERALRLEPDSSNLWKRRCIAVAAARRPADDPPFARNSRDPNAWAFRAARLFDAGKFTDAARASDCALAIDPDHLPALRMEMRSRLFACDWSRRDEVKRRITQALTMRVPIISPGNHRMLCDSPEENLIAAELMGAAYRPSNEPLWRGERYRHDRIRIAYVSSDFRRHPMSTLITGCFELHDRKRFETIGISLHPGDGSDLRQRVESALERFIHAEHMTDSELAGTMRNMEVDIAIDLNGYTIGGRLGMFAQRPAPVQVNFLGNPGTLGVPYIDYILADHTVIPEGQQRFYSEQPVYMPHSYYPHDSKHSIADRPPSRAEAGLPESGFVFCSHNAPQKIGLEIFDVWMRLLRRVDNSVIWLLVNNADSRSNLRRAAEARGVSAQRLIFAQGVPNDEHLARLRLADLALDTLPCNGHTTALDALWAGLPLVTCPGIGFAARVAASICHAAGLPELVTSSLANYEELALALAQHPGRLQALKLKLARNHGSAPIFDTLRFTRDLESAYIRMWERTQAGLPPHSFSVPATQT